MTRRWAGGVAVLVAAALAAASCGSGDDAASQGPPPTTAVGQTTTTASTTTAPRDAGPLLGVLIDAIPDVGVHPRMAGAFAAVNDAAEDCDNLASWTEHMTVAVTRFENLIPRIQSSPALEDWRGSADAMALSDAIRDRLVVQERCIDGATSATDEQISNATDVTGRAVATSDWYHLRLYDAPASVGAEFWYHSDHLGHVLAVEQLRRDPGAVDVLVVGASRVKRGVNAVSLSTRLGETVMNIGMPLLYPTVMNPWINQVRRRAEGADRVVIGVGAADGFRRCTSARIDKMSAAVLLQEAAFATLPVLAELDRELLLVGSDTPSYRDNPVLRSHRTTTIPGGQGTGRTGTAPDTAQVELERADYQALLSEPTRCGAIITALGDVVGPLTEAGVEVLVVGMPVHPELRAIAPGGGLLDAVTAEQTALTEAAGGRFLDLTDLLAADQFVDLTDPTEDGRRLITNAIGTALRP